MLSKNSKKRNNSKRNKSKERNNKKEKDICSQTNKRLNS